VYQRHVPKQLLKSYVCRNFQAASVLRKKMDPADIPVMVFDISKPIYKRVQDRLNQKGKEAVADMKP